MTHRILVFGGRDYADRAAVDGALQRIWKLFGDICIIEGGARGADRLGREWGYLNGLCVITVHANWDSYSKSAGHVRNGWMLKYCQPTYAVGFPGGNGTADMARRCEAEGVTLWRPYG